VNIWVHLPSGLDALHVVEQAASLGVLVAPGEPFFIRPGRGDVLRINAGAMTAEKSAQIGRIVAKAALTEAETTVHAISV
jgi:DNA-binding transcriptional MocR family regulator